MAVHIYEADAYEKFLKVEGAEYTRHSHNFGMYGYAAFKEAWDKGNPGWWDWWVEAVGPDDGTSNSELYGEGGYRRYHVDAVTGEVILLADTTYPEAVARAQAIGFTAR